MWSSFICVTPAIAAIRLSVAPVIGFSVVRLAMSRSSCRVTGAVWPGLPVMYNVGEVAVDGRDARLEHGRDVAERLRCRRVEQVGEAGIAMAVLDHVAVEILDRAARRNRRLHVLVAEQGVEADIAARLVGEHIGLAGGAGRAVLRAVHGEAEKIGLRLGRVARGLGRLRPGRGDYGGDDARGG